jgi:hypothetical protein
MAAEALITTTHLARLLKGFNFSGEQVSGLGDEGVRVSRYGAFDVTLGEDLDRGKPYHVQAIHLFE